MAYKGVEQQGKLWAAFLYKGGRKIFVGVDQTERIAAAVHDLAVIQFGGQKEDLNFPDGIPFSLS